ncbi:hypothetical protein DMC47_03030 [Nostoc sp. 3335mG]|nr:hypothetical protein DMC47_03030 [Nostoc sp. 3335mG]
MAYVDFASDEMFAALAVPPSQPVSGFSPLEWSVIALAERDSIRSLATPGRLALAFGSLFAAQRRNPALADPRLEALRRIAVLHWHRGDRVPVAEQTRFLTAGFSTAQYATLRASIMRARERPSIL